MTGSARPRIPEGLVRGGVVAVARRLRADDAIRIADALAEGGVLAYELTLNEPQDDALQALEAVARRRSADALEIGAGTVLTIGAAQRAVDAGATFLVMPHLDTDIVRWAADRGVPAFPGAATPTEVLAGWRAGAAAVKVFPASVLGPSFIRELRGPLPEVPLVPTGGVTADNAPSFIKAGAAAVGLGGWLLGDGETTGVRQRAGAIVAVVAAARAERA